MCASPAMPQTQAHQRQMSYPPENKRGAISHQLPPILQRLGIEQEQWHYLTTPFESPFKGIVGAAHRLKAAYQALGYRRTPGVAACRRCFSA